MRSLLSYWIRQSQSDKTVFALRRSPMVLLWHLLPTLHPHVSVIKAASLHSDKANAINDFLTTAKNLTGFYLVSF